MRVPLLLLLVLSIPLLGASPVAAAPPCAPTEETAGDGDAAFPDLTWLATRAGRKVVVAWSSAEVAAARVEYAVDGGPVQSVDAAVPATTHAVALRVPTPGAQVCFRVIAGEVVGGWHAVRSANAWLAREDDAYRINFVLSVTGAAANVEGILAGVPRFAERFADATDGHVRVGRVLVLHGVPDAIAAETGIRDSYSALADVVVSARTSPTASATAPRDGIRTWDGAVSLGLVSHGVEPAIVQGEVTVALATIDFGRYPEELGHVLAHEMGHYVFGMYDLYSMYGLGAECFDEVTRISLMSADRDARELDDDAVPCPPGTVQPDYVPSWRYVRARFPLVPERPAGPVPGPFDAGPSYALRVLRADP